MFIDPHFPTILPPDFGMFLGVALNIVVAPLAMFTARKLQRFRWLPHIVACVWLVFSPLLFAFLLLPRMQADEVPGPGYGFIVLPVLLSSGCLVLCYGIVACWLGMRALWNRMFPESAEAGL